MRRALEIYDMRLRLFERSEGRCEVCEKPMSFGQIQMAHRLRQSKANLKKWGKDIIHHENNLVATCSLSCNAKVSTSNWREVFSDIAKDRSMLEVLKEKGYDQEQKDNN